METFSPPGQKKDKIMPGEQVKFLVRFSDFTGLYMYHCHLIEHEDMGMMVSLLL